MSRWQNFQIWRGKLPHWRALGVDYYVTFRHRRSLDEGEATLLYLQLFRAQRSKFDYLILCVLPEKTEMIFRLQEGQEELELSDVVEKAKRKAAALITKKTGEKYGPFYQESFDRIVRDESELEQLWLGILGSPVDEGLVSEPEDYCALFVADRP
ncbi:MAG: hypothetical protein MUC92_08045 [Fimbriimonadaceae bacterium]|jgi:hypothetical protein|nr:hypothetical protein [Fimbriimonadaceae bacterium]